MTTIQERIPTFVSSQPLSTALIPCARICTAYIGQRTQESQKIFQKSYLRFGRLVIRPLLPSSLMADTTTWHSMLTCLAIFRRFMNTANLGKDTRSVSARLLGLLIFWSKKYETYSIDCLLKDLVTGTTSNLEAEAFQTVLLTGSLSYKSRISSSKTGKDPIDGDLENWHH